MVFKSGDYYLLNWVIIIDGVADLFPVEYLLTDERKEVAGMKFAKFIKNDDSKKVQWLSHSKAAKMYESKVLDPEEEFTA